jgi:hypothetical protein
MPRTLEGFTRPGRPSTVPLWTSVWCLLTLLSGSLPAVALAAQADSAVNAIAIGSDGYFVGSITPQTSLWYRFPYKGGQPVTITLDYEPATASRVDFSVYTGDASTPRQEADTPTRTDNSLSLIWHDASPRDVYLRVVNNSPDTSASFVGNVTPASQIAASASASSVSSMPLAASPAEAVTVQGDGSLLGTIAPRQAVWYRFWYANPGAQATIQATFTPAGFRPDLNVYTGADVSNLSQQSGSATESADTRQRVVNLASAQWVYFTLANNNDGSPLAYTGSVTPVGTPPVQPAPGISVDPSSLPAGAAVTIRGTG